jgi:hypothetical protein
MARWKLYKVGHWCVIGFHLGLFELISLSLDLIQHSLVCLAFSPCSLVFWLFNRIYNGSKIYVGSQEEAACGDSEVVICPEGHLWEACSSCDCYPGPCACPNLGEMHLPTCLTCYPGLCACPNLGGVCTHTCLACCPSACACPNLGDMHTHRKCPACFPSPGQQ